MTGVVGYSFGNFEVNATARGDVQRPVGPRDDETTPLVAIRGRKLTVASYNVLNLDARRRATTTSGPRWRRRSSTIWAARTSSPLQEIQDNNGTINDGTTDATETLQALVDAIAAAGGPDVCVLRRGAGGRHVGRRAGRQHSQRLPLQPGPDQLVEFMSLTPDVLTTCGVRSECVLRHAEPAGWRRSSSAARSSR